MKLTNQGRAERQRLTAVIADALKGAGMRPADAYANIADFLIQWGVPASSVHVENLAAKGRQKEVTGKQTV